MLADMLSTTELARCTGVSDRIIDYWLQAGALEPAVRGIGTGNPHRWPPTEVAIVCCLADARQLLGGHLPRRLACELAAQLRAGSRVAIAHAGRASIMVVADGRP